MTPARSDRRRRWLGVAAVMVFAVTLFVALVAGWARHTLVDSREFAVRATVTLGSAEVRKELAEQITDQIIVQSESSTASYRSLLVGVVSDIIDTQAFRMAFRIAVEEAHRALLAEHTDKVLLQLGASLSDLTGSAEDTSAGMAQSLPSDVSSVLVDVTPVVDRIDPYRIAHYVDEVSLVSAILAMASAGAVIALARRRRRALLWLGLATVVAATGVLAVAVAVPDIAADRVTTIDLVAPVRAAVTRFMADLRSLAIGMIALGVVLASAATAAGPPHLVSDARSLGARLAQAVGGAHGRARQGVAGLGLVTLGVFVYAAPSAALTVTLAVLGGVLGYIGLVAVFSAVLGADVAPADDLLHPDVAGVEWSPRLVLLCVLAGVLSVGVGLAGISVIAETGGALEASGELRCNGSEDLCDRRLDQVAFAGTHNSMSSSSDPGWLFAEQLTGIPAQLRSGIRALLVKTHYGIATGVTVAGAELVVTDEGDESAVNRAEEVDELGPEAVARAEQLQKLTTPTASSHDIYLCHVYCELGATRFSTALRDIHRFVDSHPNEVVMLFIGDYVSAADTARAFDEAGLKDRLWTYDTSQPPPTLRDMIKARRTLLVLTEHSGPPPPWYTTGYGIFQDTPYTFASPSDFNCNPNRGPSDAPLFEINHFLTNAKPPSATEAEQVNSEAALMARVQDCQEQRGRLPTILAVDFASVGDLIGVVDKLNGS